MRFLWSWFRWRTSHDRVGRAALRMMRDEGETALLRARERARHAEGDGDPRRARYWRAVCAEIGRQVQRDLIRAAILAPVSRSQAPRPPQAVAHPCPHQVANPPPPRGEDLRPRRPTLSIVPTAMVPTASDGGSRPETSPA